MAESTEPVARIELEELRERVEANQAFLIDVRRSAHGEQIYGAIRYDPSKLRAAEKLVLPLPKTDGLIVLYDEDGTGNILAELAQKLSNDGYAEIRILEGGFRAWKDAGGKTEERTVEQPVPLASGHQVER